MTGTATILSVAAAPRARVPPARIPDTDRQECLNQ
jgi:hypothetical protein